MSDYVFVTHYLVLKTIPFSIKWLEEIPFKYPAQLNHLLLKHW